MPKYEIIGPGYKGRSTNVNASRCINFYPEMNSQDSKSVGSLVGTPGLKLFVDTLLDSVRGAHFFNNLIYFVAGNKLYSVDIAGNIFPVIDAGTGVQAVLGTSTGRVAMADNGLYSVDGAVANQLAIVDGQNYLIVNVTTGATYGAAYPSKSVCFIGGYFMIDMGGAKVGISALYDGTSGFGLSISTADAYPDNLQAVVNYQNQAWMIGEYSAEIWLADGSGNPFPFTRQAVIDFGTPSPYSVAKGSNTVFMLANVRNNDGGESFGVGIIEGYSVKIVSPQSINYQISKYNVISDAFGFCYSDKGHNFYQLTFPSANATWVYDSTTDLWHERSYYQGSPYVIGRHMSNCYVSAWGKHYVGAYNSGKIYEMSENYLDDDGQPIASVRISPPIDDKSDGNNIFISKLQIDAETGTGKTIVTANNAYAITTNNDTSDTNVVLTINDVQVISTYLSEDDTVTVNLFPFLFMIACNNGLTNFPTTGYWSEFIPFVTDNGDGTITVLLPTHTATIIKNDAGINAFFDPIDGMTNHAHPTFPQYPIVRVYSTNPIKSFTMTLQNPYALNITPSVNPIPITPPIALLSWSVDGGHTWSNDHAASMGKIGDYKRRIIWRRLGVARNRVFRIAISDAIKKVLTGAYMDLQKGIG